MTGTLRAYSHPGLTKADFLTELAEHAAQDRIIRGNYWNEGKGCAVGCSLHSVSNRLDLGWASKRDLGKHTSYETYLGIPEVLASLEDCIFEGLPPGDAQKWPILFSKAIPAGADLSGIWDTFAPWLLREIALPAAGSNKAVRKAITGVADGYETNWASEAPASVRDTAAAVYSARSAAAAYAAYAASRAARCAAAASAAETAAYAASAADAAASAAAADAASYAATAAADATARRSAYLRMADKLCDLLAASPVPAL